MGCGARSSTSDVGNCNIGPGDSDAPSAAKRKSVYTPSTIANCARQAGEQCRRSLQQAYAIEYIAPSTRCQLESIHSESKKWGGGGAE